MKAFSKLLFSSVQDSIFFESCGVADLITSCLGRRNRKCAEAFARNDGRTSFDELEEEMLQRQKLQGLVVLHWGLGHSLKMDRLGVVGRHWSGMNIAGKEDDMAPWFDSAVGKAFLAMVPGQLLLASLDAVREATEDVLAAAEHYAGTAWNVLKIMKAINPASSVSSEVLKSTIKDRKT
ncbi:Glycerol-3-phosphate dehydrogenase [NAD(+)] [Camellia lanceoleosa]|uniref:Glycerol-3-phosphate dehydrogenase [NAD(+)] n=1 Tax=Camellia lanceoleosa TaxID=1840588 RepID=A0ACC0I0M3_9ERIC|nr:Glycerol-3-phosphate dehydrogenase [NAD(+)] [Camellia lanceoleosa]